MDNPLDLKLLMNQATNSITTVTTPATTKTYKCEICNEAFTDKMYYDSHKQSHQKELPIVQIVMNPSATQVISQPAQAHQPASPIVIQDDQLVTYKRAYGVDPQQVYTLAPVTHYQIITNNRTGTVSLSQSGQTPVNISNYTTPTYVVATADGHQIHALPEAIIQTDPTHPQHQLSHDQHHVQADQQTQLVQQIQHHSQQQQDQSQQQQQQQETQQQQHAHTVHVVTNNSRLSRGTVVTLKERPFKCDQCTASFIESSELEEHKKKHTGDGPFTCDDCHFTFMYKSHFKSHKTRCLKRRATMPNPPKPIINPSPVKRQFPTNHLNQVIQKQVQIPQQHQAQTQQYQQVTVPQVITKVNGPNVNQRVSLGSRQLIKQTMQSKFNPSNPSFKRVKKESRLDRPYECEDCDASFQNENDLRNHKSKHTGEGPFKCEECRFVFLYRKLYDAHRRRCEKRRKEMTVTVLNTSGEVESVTSLPHSTSSVAGMVITPNQVQHQEIHLQPGQTIATAVPASLGSTVLPANLQMHGISVSGQPSVLEMRPTNSQSQDLQHQMQLSHTPVIEQVLVSPASVSNVAAGRHDIKYEVIPVPSGIVDAPDGVNQIMSLIKVKGQTP